MHRRQWSRSCSEKKRRERKLCLEKLSFLYLFCAFLCPRENGALSVSSVERMAGTTRLELATSAVTVTSTFNDMEEHGRHRKSLEVRRRQRYCVSRCVSRSRSDIHQMSEDFRSRAIVVRRKLIFFSAMPTDCHRPPNLRYAIKALKPCVKQ